METGSHPVILLSTVSHQVTLLNTSKLRVKGHSLKLTPIMYVNTKLSTIILLYMYFCRI